MFVLRALHGCGTVKQRELNETKLQQRDKPIEVTIRCQYNTLRAPRAYLWSSKLKDDDIPRKRKATTSLDPKKNPIKKKKDKVERTKTGSRLAIRAEKSSFDNYRLTFVLVSWDCYQSDEISIVEEMHNMYDIANFCRRRFGANRLRLRFVTDSLSSMITRLKGMETERVGGVESNKTPFQTPNTPDRGFLFLTGGVKGHPTDRSAPQFFFNIVVFPSCSKWQCNAEKRCGMAGKTCII